jgi:hypothetical protein
VRGEAKTAQLRTNTSQVHWPNGHYKSPPPGDNLAFSFKGGAMTMTTRLRAQTLGSQRTSIAHKESAR